MKKTDKKSAMKTDKKSAENSASMISVMIPFFKPSDGIENCLKSILRQTYLNFEVLIAAEPSLYTEEKGIRRCEKWDERIHVEECREKSIWGHIRRTRGEYVIFIRPEDSISVDYLRKMLEAVRNSHLDVAVSDFLFRDGAGQLCYYNLDPLRMDDVEYAGEEIRMQYLRCAAKCISWRTWGNKLFRKSLLMECLSKAKEIRAGASYEDICLLTLAMSKASRLKNIHHVYYIQGMEPEDEKNKAWERRDYEWAKKEALEIGSVFQSFDESLAQSDQEHGWLMELRGHCLNAVLEQVEQDTVRQRLSALPEFHGQEGFTEDDGFFQSVFTQLTPAFLTWENVKEAIRDSKTKCVSFDIFDTLILRNVLEPIDIFSLLNSEFNRLAHTKSFVDFSEIRRECEARAREAVFRQNPSFEDITLDEIYGQIREGFMLDPSAVDSLKEKECELELQLCIPRQTGKELYEFAKYCGKQVIFISDMYLPKDVIEKILHKNGYTGYDHLFLSSEQRLGKYTCNLFRRAKRELKLKDHQAIHIGDNWIVDICNAQKSGFQAFHLPKPLDLLRHCNPGIFTGNFYNKIFAPNGSWIDGRCAADLFQGIRGMLALVANRFFDFPYINFRQETDFNTDPYFIGYFAVGMHLYALTEWLLQDATQNGYERIHFLARDGHLPIQAYRIITAGRQDVPQPCYTYMSRHMIALCDIDTPADIYTLAHKMNILAAAPKKIFKMFRPAIPEEVYWDAEKILMEKGFIYDKPFRTMRAYYDFIRFFTERCVDFELLRDYRKKLKAYFTSVFSAKDCFFDVGYNGRVESALTAICGYEMHSYYLHAYREIAMSRAERQGFTMRTFFDYQPVTTFLVREQVFSKLAPSAVGIDFSVETPEVLFGDYDKSTAEELVTELLQKAAIDFVRNYKTTFSGLMPNMHYRFMDASLPFEFFMHHAMERDRYIFKSVDFEDEFGEETIFNLHDYWGYNLYLFGMNTGILPSGGVLPSGAAPYEGIYQDGLFMKFYHMVNKWFPKGSAKRDFVKRLVHIFIH